MSESEFQLLASTAAGVNLRARVNALVGLRAVSANSPHSEEAIRLALKYLDEKHAEGNVAAVQVLKYQNHSAWKDYAMRFMNEGDPETRELWQQVLKSK